MVAEQLYPMPMSGRSPTDAQKIAEAEIVQQLKEGRETTIDKVVATFGPVVFNSLKRKFHGVLNDDDLEDVLSVAVFRLWETRATYDPAEASLGAWLYVIANRVAIDTTRRRRGEISLDQIIERVLPPAVDPDDAATQAGNCFLIPRLRQLLDALSERDRQIVWTMANVGPGESWTEPLIHELGMNANALRVQRTRIAQRLRQELNKEMSADTDIAKRKRGSHERMD